MLLALLSLSLAEPPMKIEVSSPAFTAGTPIPARHTCEGEDLSPPLAWGSPPSGTRSWALIVDDPDAPGKTWVHWLAWDIPAEARGLPEGVVPTATSPVQGRNDFRNVGWVGPCPPKGHGAHRYVFRLYALDRPLALPPGATRAEVENTMAGHVLASGELTGKFHRDR